MSFKVLAFLVPPWNEVILKDHVKISIILHLEENRMRRSEGKPTFVSRTLTEMCGISNLYYARMGIIHSNEFQGFVFPCATLERSYS